MVVFFSSKLLNINYFIRRITKKLKTKFIDKYLYNNKLEESFKFCHALNQYVNFQFLPKKLRKVMGIGEKRAR